MIKVFIIPFLFGGFLGPPSSLAADPSESPQLQRIHRLSKLWSEGHLSIFQVPDLSKPTLGVIGDSLAAGSIADLRLTAEVWPLAGAAADFFLNGRWISQRTYGHRPPVTRIYDTPASVARDRARGITEGHRAFENRGFRELDCEECAFGPQLAVAMGFPHENVFVAAKLKSRVDSLADQVDRIALPLKGLPNLILVSFTGNDLCNKRNENISFEEKRQQIAASFYQGLQRFTEYVANSSVETSFSDAETVVAVVGPPNVASLLRDPTVLNHQVPYSTSFNPFHREMVTCREVRQAARPYLDKLNNSCSYVLRTNPGDLHRVSHIDDLSRAIYEGQQQATERAARELSRPGLRFVFLTTLADIKIRGQDLANDCFHPSKQGHTRMAEALFSELTRLGLTLGSRPAMMIDK
ncbi:MAG: SGNH/GDSL hydrolase family protein [Bdellovibrionales bacterium]